MKLFELAINNGDGQPITTFRLATDIEQLTEMVVPLRFSHPEDIILVWEVAQSDERFLERETQDAIHVFGKFSEELKKNPQAIPMPAIPLEMLGLPPGTVICRDYGCS